MKILNLIKKIRSIKDVENDSEKKNFKESWFSNFLLALGSVNFFFVFAVLTISSIGFLLGFSIDSLHIPFAIGATIVFGYLTARAFFYHHIPYFLLILIFFTATILVSNTFAAQFYDLSYDGQWYHQDIILALSEEWNPVYTKIDTATIPTADLLNAYPKMAEINQAAWYKFTGKIELSKMFNLFMMISSFVLLLSLLLKIRIIDPIIATLSTLLITLNPVAICQLVSFYIDGHVYALMVSIVAILGTIYFSNRKYLFLPLVILITLIVNVKLTAILFSLLFITLFLGYCWNSEKLNKMITVAFISFIAFGLATVLIGFNPYVTNTFRYHNPLYPTIGNGSTDYVKVNAPENFYGKDPLSLLVYSTFSESAFLKGDGKKAQLKIPFTFNKEEIMIFSSTDPIEGGFGPLFSGIIIISLLIYILGATKGHTGEVRIIYLTTGMIFITAVIVAASFYARFIPQFWVIPCIAFLFAIIINSRVSNILSYILFALIIMNLTMITFSNFSFNSTHTALMKQELNTLKAQTQNQRPLINFGDFRSNRIRFAEAGINFEYTTAPIDCQPKTRLLEYLIQESDITACNFQVQK